jgi:glycosyltransferase involved in cell wall biosynthesis
MRIVYPLLWSRPGRQACREQSMNTVAALARRGHEVTLLMPRGADDPAVDPDNLRAYFDVEGDFRVVQRASPWAGESLARSLMWLRRVRRDPVLRGADLLYSRIPAMLALGGLSPLPFATDHYRSWPDDLPAIRLLFRATARHRRCLGIVTHSDFAAESYRRIGVDPERLLVAHNGAEPRRMGAMIDKTEARARLGLPRDRAIAAYAGRLNALKGLDQLFALAARRPDILFLLIGSEGRGPVEEKAAERHNVQVIGWQAPNALPAWLSAADVLLIPPSRAPLERHRNCVLPLKLFAYLAAGRPILAPVAPDTAELLRDGENALLVPPDRPDLAAAALDRILAEPALTDRLSGNAKLLSEGLTWDARAARIAAFLQARLDAQRSAYRSTVVATSKARMGAVQAPTTAGK